MVKSRRKAREAALRALYELEIGHGKLRETILDTIENASLPLELSYYAEELIRGVDEKIDFIDDKLAAALKDWGLDRIATIDRNVLRIATWELFFEAEVPPAVVINEAIEIARKYSTAESGKFVNGVLGTLLAQSPKANWVPIPQADFEEPAEKELEPEELTITEDAPEVQELAKVGLWKIRKDKGDDA